MKFAACWIQYQVVLAWKSVPDRTWWSARLWLDPFSEAVKRLNLRRALSYHFLKVWIVVYLVSKLRRLLHFLFILRLLWILDKNRGRVPTTHQLHWLSQLAVWVGQFYNRKRVDYSFYLRFNTGLCLKSPRVVLCCRIKKLHILDTYVSFCTSLVGLLEAKLGLLRGSWVAVLGWLHEELLTLVVLDVSVFIYVGLFANESWFKVHHYRINKIIKHFMPKSAFELHCLSWHPQYKCSSLWSPRRWPLFSLPS